jgi:ATP-dependent DNA helicase RecQ
MGRDALRYTTSARLGLWDSVPNGRQEFMAKLKFLLRSTAHATLECEHREFVATDDPDLASLLSIIDKLIARGNPTFVDWDFEKFLLFDQFIPYLKTNPLENSVSVGHQFESPVSESFLNEVLTAAGHLLCIPYSGDPAWHQQRQNMQADVSDLCSHEEELFLKGFCEVFSGALASRLRRQVLIKDLVTNANHSLGQNRVDFAIQLCECKWVFEIDGAQHSEPGQRQLDEERDSLLCSGGWQVHRISAGIVREHLHDWLQSFKTQLPEMAKEMLAAVMNRNVMELADASPAYHTALTSILLPVAVHRCLRGLIQLFQYQMIPLRSEVSLLVIEEDLPVVAEAFYQLATLWWHLRVMCPGVPVMPVINLDLLGGAPLVSSRQHPWISCQRIDEPETHYDLVISHAFFLFSGDRGILEKEYFSGKAPNLLEMRSAIGLREERHLHWSEPLVFDLSDVESALQSEGTEHPLPMPMAKHQALLYFLRLIFRKRNFWDGQLRVILRLLQGKPTIVLLPTGGGKSLTYQFSGLLLPGMTLVIDPLVSLMNDQVENLSILGVDLVNFISGQVDASSRGSVLREMEAGRLAFVFISPERLQIQEFRNSLRSVVSLFPISLAVVDEAHCVSEWGHDFRPSYLHMPLSLQRYCSHDRHSHPTFVGLTGTASFAVLTDIQLEMGITDEEAIILPVSFDRKELRFDVRRVPMGEKSSALQTCKTEMPRILRSNPQAFYNLKGDNTNGGIIFCPHANGSLGVVSVSGIVGHHNYYSGKKPKNFAGDWTEWNRHKLRVQKEFKNNRLQELVSTTSFGMGIDKPNIRYTIHYTMPHSVEAFYQQAGRAGRNGKPGYAYCCILYSDDNWDAALKILNEPDHSKALQKLNAISWDDRGDLLVQLWLLLDSYRGRESEKSSVLEFWMTKLRAVVDGMPPGSTNTQEIAFKDERGREIAERAIQRLRLLGVVDDYTIDWQTRKLSVRVQKIGTSDIKRHLKNYLLQYKFEDFADKCVRGIAEESVDTTLEQSVGVFVDFVYDEIVAKRKQALRTIGEMCREFSSDQQFRDSILAYLQESEFSEQLKTWVNKPFDDIGQESLNEFLEGVTTLEELKRLVGTTRRLLDEDPQNLALRFLSMSARARSTVESDSGVVQEAMALAIEIDRNRKTLRDPEELIVALVNEVRSHREDVLDPVVDIVIRRAGTPGLARRILSSKITLPRHLLTGFILLLVASAVEAAKDCSFHQNLKNGGRHD